MLWKICRVNLATGEWDCGPPDEAASDLLEAIAIATGLNGAQPWKPGMTHSPNVLWPADMPTPDKAGLKRSDSP